VADLNSGCRNLSNFRLGSYPPGAVRPERPFVKDQETVQKFIELRSRGLSYARIAEQLGVAKATLINWSNQHQHLIQNLRTIEWEDFLDRTLASKQERVQALMEQLRRLETELAGRDLAAVPTPRLQAMTELLRRRLDRECGCLQFSAGVQLSRDDETRQAVQDWQA
jgi:transposase-like protein